MRLTSSTPKRGNDANPQPMDVIRVPGALLRLPTLATISGQSVSTLYREARNGKLKLVKSGTRCTRVTAEDARAYLESRGASA